MAAIQKTISPIDGSVYVERTLADEDQVAAALDAAHRASAAWRATPLAERGALLEKLVARILDWTEPIAEEICLQMGRPIRHAPLEVNTFADRARTMIGLAPAALAELDIGGQGDQERFITREPLGVSLVVSPWNYPYLTSVNAVVPSLMAGNCVLLKTSAQTPLVAERYVQAAAAAGLPEGVLQGLHLDHDQVARIIARRRVDHVSFTGSVAGGRAVARAAAEGLLAPVLELGGKDAAYVRADADVERAAADLADGAFFNAGQSCCGIKRIYVHRDVAEAFTAALVEQARSAFRLGDPRDPDTTLGPLVSAAAAERVRAQVRAAVAAGAEPLLAEPDTTPGSAYLAPQILARVDHGMALMREETFGPAVGVMAVASDDEAVAAINDSRFGLTAAVFTRDRDAALRLGRQVQVGTWFMNRCDYLDPLLAWVGVKDSGRGCSLSRIGYEQLTRPKSFSLQPAGPA
jgi:acyl-CoA reductase-like NAD-dependent aldehyde dehydrogenase